MTAEDEEDPLKGFNGRLSIPLIWYLWWCMGRGAEWFADSDEEETNRYKRKLSLKRIPRRKPKDDVL